MKEKAESNIKKILSVQEKGYTGIGEENIQLMSSLNRLNSATKNLSENLTENSDEGKEILKLSEKMNYFFRESNGGFSSDTKQLNAYKKQIRSAWRAFIRISNSIDGIKNFLEVVDLEVIDLIISSFGNTQGYILPEETAKELKVSLANLRNLRERLFILDRFSQRKSTSLEQLALTMNRLIQKRINSSKILRNSCEVFVQSMGNIRHMLDVMNYSGELCRSFLMEIIQEVQHQDIYKQSVEHILVLFDKEAELPETKNLEEKLDHLTFLGIICNFSHPLLDEIASKVERNIFSFESRLESVTSHFDYIEKFLEDYSEDVDIYTSGFEESLSLYPGILFSGTNHDFFRYLKNEEFKEYRELLGEISTEIGELLLELNSQFKKIKKMGIYKEHPELRSSIDNLNYPINRIKLKIKSIQNAEKTIEKDIEIIRELKEEIEISSTANINAIAEMNESRNKITGRFYETISPYKEEFRKFGEELNQRNKKTEKSISELGKSVKILEETTDLFRNTETTVAQEKQVLLQQEGISQWEIKNKSLTDVINTFTIFKQKLAASKLSGIERKETALQEGSVTLF